MQTYIEKIKTEQQHADKGGSLIYEHFITQATKLLALERQQIEDAYYAGKMNAHLYGLDADESIEYYEQKYGL